MNKFSFLFIGLFLMASLSMTAQKFGYLNSQLLIVESPDISKANESLKAFETQLIANGQAMVDVFQKNYDQYLKDSQDGVLSPQQAQLREGELGNEQRKIQNYELEVQQKLAVKREELYKPIIDRINSAVEAVGKENGYTMIFDASNGVILHAPEADDVMPLVKAKLGL